MDAQPPQKQGYGAVLAVSIVHVRRDRVVGEMKVGPEHLNRHGCLHCGALLGFADELATHGVGLLANQGHSFVPLESKINLFRRCRLGLIGGESVPLHTGQTTMVWQTSIFEPAGDQVGVVTHTFVVTNVDEAKEAGSGSNFNDAPISAKGIFPQSKRLLSTKIGGSQTPAAELRRERIAEAACNVIAEKGFAGATIREIAEAAGLHVPTLYQYVSSKDEVLELVYSWAMERLRTDVSEAAHGCATAREKLLATVSAALANGNRYRRQIGVLNRELKSLPDKARARVLGEYQDFLSRIADLIREGIQDGEFRPVEPDLAANMIEAICDIWPLRQFAVKRFGLEAFEKEVKTFIDGSLSIR